MQYRKKPVIIDAIQWTGSNEFDIIEFIRDDSYYFEFNAENKTIKIKTLEGIMTANVEDYIIRGVKGEYYPCKPDIFKQTYDILGEDDALIGDFKTENDKDFVYTSNGWVQVYKTKEEKLMYQVLEEVNKLKSIIENHYGIKDNSKDKLIDENFLIAQKYTKLEQAIREIDSMLPEHECNKACFSCPESGQCKEQFAYPIKRIISEALNEQN